MKFVNLFVVFIIGFSCILTTPAFSMQQNGNNQVFSIDFMLPAVQFEKNSESEQWLYIDGWYQKVNENGFQLPSGTFSVKIPTNTHVQDFTVDNVKEYHWNDICLHQSSVEKVQANVYSDNGYCSKQNQVDFCSLKYIRREKDGYYAIFFVNPFDYDEKKNLLVARSSFTIHLILSSDPSAHILESVKPVDKFDHCVVVRKDQIPLFFEYKCFLEKRGIRTIIFEYERIEDFTGRTSYEKLRNALNELYLQNGIESAFLIGKDSNIPMVTLKPFGRESDEDNIVLSDFYYADLTSEWDSNLNGHLGEFESDRIDLSPEIAIGRLPLNNSSEIRSYLSHLLSFFEEDKTNRKRILTAGAWLNFKEEEPEDLADCSDIDGGQIVYTNYRNYFSDYSYTGLYEQEGVRLSKVVNNGKKLTYENFITSYNDIDPLVVLLSGHGSSFGVSRKIWDNDENRNETADWYEIDTESYLDLLSLHEIDTHHYSMVFADSCSTCKPSSYDSLGERFIEDSAVGYLGYSSPAYFFLLHDTAPSSFELNTSCFGLMANVEYSFSKDYTIGQSIVMGTKFYWENCQKSFERKFLGEQVQNIYTLCYFGDPMLTLDSFDPVKQPVYTSQGYLEKGSNTHNIQEILISEETDFYNIKCRIYEKLQEKDYFVSILLNTDGNDENGIPESHGAEYFACIGFNERGTFLYSFAKWNPYLGEFDSDLSEFHYNHYYIDQLDSSITIRIPKSYLETDSFEYLVGFTNAISSDYSFFPVQKKGSLTYSIYPKKQEPGPEPDPEDPPDKPEPPSDPEPEPEPPKDPPPNPPDKPEPPHDPEPEPKPEPPKEPEEDSIVRRILIRLKIGDLYAMVNDTFIKLELAPLEKDDRVFVPLRFIAESFGAEIDWKEDDFNNGEGTIKMVYTKANSSQVLIQMHTLCATAFVTTIENGIVVHTKELSLDAAPFIVKPEDRTVVPVRFISESFGASIEWDAASQSIQILLEEHS